MKSKMLLTFDINPARQEAYLRFVLGEFIPRMQKMGFEQAGAWHTAYGNYPGRLLVFVAESAEEMQQAAANEEFARMEERIKSFVTHYERRIVPFEERFQF